MIGRNTELIESLDVLCNDYARILSLIWTYHFDMTSIFFEAFVVLSYGFPISEPKWLLPLGKKSEWKKCHRVNSFPAEDGLFLPNLINFNSVFFCLRMLWASSNSSESFLYAQNFPVDLCKR